MTTSATGGGAAGGAGMAGSYAGDVTPGEAWEALSSNPDAVLVDVRSAAEWTFVGLPDLRGIQKEPLLVAWQDFPGMTPNAAFLQGLQEGIPGRDAPVYFLCRSGGRSRSAAIAATGAGFGACYNVAGGFEGNLDEAGHRGQHEGWKAQGLPWVQS